MRPTELGEAIQYDMDETQAFRHNNLGLALAAHHNAELRLSEDYVDPDRIDDDPDDLGRWASVTQSGDDIFNYGWTTTHDHRDQAEGALYEAMFANCPGQPVLLIDLDTGESWAPRVHLTFKALGPVRFPVQEAV